MALHRTLAAALVTLAALALLAAIALGAGGDEPSQPAAATRPKVRTVVVHRTIHVRPKHIAPTTAGAAAAAPAVAAPTGPTTAVSSLHDEDVDHGRGDDDDRGHGGDDDHSGHGGGDD